MNYSPDGEYWYRKSFGEEQAGQRRAKGMRGVKDKLSLLAAGFVKGLLGSKFYKNKSQYGAFLLKPEA